VINKLFLGFSKNKLFLLLLLRNSQEGDVEKYMVKSLLENKYISFTKMTMIWHLKNIPK